MTYNKETVIGVIEQVLGKIERCTIEFDYLNRLMRDAKDGKFSTPTLEEVWKEKVAGRCLPAGYDYIFQHENEFYITRFIPGRDWESPKLAIKL